MKPLLRKSFSMFASIQVTTFFLVIFICCQILSKGIFHIETFAELFENRISSKCQLQPFHQFLTYSCINSKQLFFFLFSLCDSRKHYIFIFILFTHFVWEKQWLMTECEYVTWRWFTIFSFERKLFFLKLSDDIYCW